MMRGDFSGAAAGCLVGDRPHLPEMRQLCRQLGGAWLEGVDLWESENSMRFLLLAAPDQRRIRLRAPLILLGRDEVGLELAVIDVCSRLSDVQCAWARFLEPAALAIVDRVILADARPAGVA